MKPLLLLHGAIGSQQQFADLKHELSKYYAVSTIDFGGHGGTEVPEVFSIERFAAEVLSWLEDNGLSMVSIFGYSMGGYVALYLAKHHPQRVERVVTLATKLHWDAVTAEKEMKMLNPEVIEQKVPKFAAELATRHQPADWKLVLERTAAMLFDLGQQAPLSLSDYEHIICPVLMLLGDRDKMVSLVETVSVYHQLPNGQLAVLPKTPHPIEQVNTAYLSFLIRQFIQ